jgi:hypothetical protein
MSASYDHHKAETWFYDADEECKPHEMLVLASLIAHPDLEELVAHEGMGGIEAVLVSEGARAALSRWHEMPHWERGNALVAFAEQMKETVMNVARREWARARREDGET